jgi:hypothetical protein
MFPLTIHPQMMFYVTQIHGIMEGFMDKYQGFHGMKKDLSQRHL